MTSKHLSRRFAETTGKSCLILSDTDSMWTRKRELMNLPKLNNSGDRRWAPHPLTMSLMENNFPDLKACNTAHRTWDTLMEEAMTMVLITMAEGKGEEDVEEAERGAEVVGVVEVALEIEAEDSILVEGVAAETVGLAQLTVIMVQLGQKENEAHLRTIPITTQGVAMIVLDVIAAAGADKGAAEVTIINKLNLDSDLKSKSKRAKHWANLEIDTCRQL